MSYTITAYTADVYEEFALPAIDNADHTIVFSGTRFALPNDVALNLEVIDGIWKILPSRHYTIRTLGTNHLEYTLAEDAMLSLLVAGGSLSLVVRKSSQTLRAGYMYRINDISRITIGKDKGCTIRYSELNLISGVHTDIVKSGESYIIRDHSEKGTYLNGQRIKDAVTLTFGDIINIFGLTIVFLGNVISVLYVENLSFGENVSLRPLERSGKKQSTVPSTAEQQTYVDTVEFYHRPPRNMITLNSEPVSIDPPPEKREGEKKPLGMIIGPSFTMAIPMLLGSGFMIYSRSQANNGTNNAFMYVGLITALTSAIVGVIWTLINLRYSNRKEREEELLRFEAYGDYLFECASDISEKYEENHASLCKQYPSAEICATYTAETNCLWSRNKNHADFLLHRIGTGEIPFQVPITIAKQKLSYKTDTLALKPKIIKDSYSTLTDVPICIDFSKMRLIGVVSDSMNGTMDIVRVLVTQIAANNCYTEVKTVFAFDSNRCNKELWDFTRWLPHAWTDGHEMRYVASNDLEKSDVFYEVTRILRSRAETAQSETKAVRPIPHYIIFLSSADLLEDELISKYLLDPQEHYGVSTVILAEHMEELPNECEYIINNSSDNQGIVSISAGNQAVENITFDRIEPEQLDAFVRQLCGVRVSEVESNGSIPSALTFFDMLHVNSPDELNVLERWRKNRTFDSMKACVGQKAGGTDFYIDIHEKHHGPHGLVAGTTGSGKSETLQTYILSLAVNFSPYDVAFFIIDYKGGGMANLFTDLPHLIGQVSNLSGNQVRRSMVSIKSENKRRQRVFAEYGVNNINAYTKLVKNNEAKEPIPHLFIIIDEFAELKREEPEFMRELISVAQVGRSLGVHLILSTQKPSGTVDENIWSNSKMRLCLRVQDKQDSMDMLHKPDAVTIVNPGRCYLQVGNDELYELFQSGWSGAVYDSESAADKNTIATLIEMTGRSMLTGSKVKKKLKEASKQQWLSSMVDCLLMATSSSGITIDSCHLNASLVSRLAEETMSIAEQYQLDYPRSDYNLRRLEDLIALCPDDAGSMERNTLLDILQSTAAQSARKLPERKEKTQLEVTIDTLAHYAMAGGYDQKLQLWMPVLPEMLYLNELYGYSSGRFDGSEWSSIGSVSSIEAMVGLVDDPVNQAQFPLTVDFIADGHCAVCGSVSSGKSVFLQTMIYSLITRYSPKIVNIYIVDYSSHALGCFENAPQIGGIVTDEDSDRVEKLFYMLIKELADRKKLLKGVSYSQYISIEGNHLPAFIVMLDGYANFKEKTEDAFEEELIRLSREGIGYGIYLVISSGGFGGADIQHRIGDNIKTSICLEMGDKFKYGDALRTMKFDVMPEANVKGRGLAVCSGTVLEFQTALSVQAQDDYGRIEKLSAECEAMRAAWHGSRAKQIPYIPENPVWSQFTELSEYRELAENKRYIPFAYVKETAAICSVDLANCFCFTIAGKAKSGKTDCMINMIRSASGKNGVVSVIDNAKGDLKRVAAEVGAEYVSTLREVFDFCKNLVFNIMLPDRNALKKQMLADGASDFEIYEKQSETTPHYIFIADLCEFVDMVYNHDKTVVGDMSGCIENIVEMGSLHNIYLFGCLNVDDTSKIAARKVFTEFIRDHYGVLTGGNVAGQRIFTFSNIQYSEQSRSLKPGNGYIPNVDDNTEGIRIVIPHSRG